MAVKSRKNIVKKLDTVFSQYVRLRYADDYIVECYTCGIKNHYKKMHCGHFMSRKHYSTRWDELNCQVQCYKCNIHGYGEQFRFGQRLNKEYGNDTADILESKCRNVEKFSNPELIEKTKYYESLAKKLL